MLKWIIKDNGFQTKTKEDKAANFSNSRVEFVENYVNEMSIENEIDTADNNTHKLNPTEQDEYSIKETI